ncbi:unnamed protein product [Rotaria sp. Silwood2]|nr:unnamed protein product [Rotaria sp. Silwood2]CAF3365328.1 unnamed protein product [Rotaria sp. Silwood2]CAF4144623.1 unnamed protein product [Rotaria sp. Silwood2]CAF4461658.1 unnamed protein product [Rotaria sp. Silwood2]
MASSSQPCAVSGCKRPSRALCNCCQQYLCRDHLKQHDDLIDAQLPLLADQINALSDQFNNSTLLESSGLTELKRWRDDAHKTVDQFYERKCGQFGQFVQEKQDKQRKELDRMRSNLNELIREQEATQIQIDSITESIRSLEKDVNNLQHVHFNINPLVIDDNLISIPQETTARDLLPVSSSHQTMQSTSDKVASNDKHLLAHQKRSTCFPDKSNPKSMKLTRWEIEEQATGITDAMRVNILNIISTSIDSHGTSEIQQIAKDIQNWLNETYGKSWTVEIGDARNYQPSYTRLGSRYLLKVQETRLGWTILIFKETTS